MQELRGKQRSLTPSEPAPVQLHMPRLQLNGRALSFQTLHCLVAVASRALHKRF